MVVEYLSSSSRCRLRQRGHADAADLAQVRAHCQQWLHRSLPVAALRGTKVLLALEEALAMCADRCDFNDEFEVVADFSGHGVTVRIDVPAHACTPPASGSPAFEHNHTMLHALCESAAVNEAGGHFVVTFTV